jgi:N-acetylmuramoyl-L-alanine amidase
MPYLDRLKGQLLRSVVRENVEAIRGLPPRALRRPRRVQQAVVRHYRMVVAPALLFVAISVLAAGGAEPPGHPARQASLADLSARLAVAAPAPLDPGAFPLGVRRIVLDPGHGGLDPGAQARHEPAGDLAEKTITLDVARRLRALLRESGLEVTLTRDGDETVTLQERVQRANAAHGDLFASIHVNALPTADECGIETYTLGATADPRGEQLARLENQESGYSLADYRRLLEGVYVHVRQQESQRLAQTVQRGLVSYLGAGGNPAVRDNGVKTAPFVVLVTTEMPGILIELSCLSNPEQGLRLAEPGHRQSIARGLFVGLSAYAAAHNRRPDRPGGGPA